MTVIIVFWIPAPSQGQAFAEMTAIIASWIPAPSQGQAFTGMIIKNTIITYKKI